jgi:hypothetical protein
VLLTVEHPNLTMIRFELNGSVIEHYQQQQEFCVDINCDGNIEIFFEPWKTKPLVRVNNHLLDYWCADMQLYDHMVGVKWDSEFYYRYQEKIVQGKIDYLNLKTQEDIDYYLGINNSNLDLVSQLKQYLK